MTKSIESLAQELHNARRKEENARVAHVLANSITMEAIREYNVACVERDEAIKITEQLDVAIGEVDRLGDEYQDACDKMTRLRLIWAANRDKQKEECQ